MWSVNFTDHICTSVVINKFSNEINTSIIEIYYRISPLQPLLNDRLHQIPYQLTIV